MQAFADSLNTPTRSASVQPDEEHQAHSIVIEDRSGGYPRHHRLDLDFVTTSEFRTLAASYQDVRGHQGPMIVKTAGASEPDEVVEDDDAGDGATRRRSAARRSTPRRSWPRSRRRPTPAKPGAKGRDQEIKVESLDELVEFFIAAGKKGIAVNRYKGLGEMNPDTLWETTMDPAKRTLLQVRRKITPKRT